MANKRIYLCLAHMSEERLEQHLIACGVQLWLIS